MSYEEVDESIGATLSVPGMTPVTVAYYPNSYPFHIGSFPASFHTTFRGPGTCQTDR